MTTRTGIDHLFEARVDRAAVLFPQGGNWGDGGWSPGPHIHTLKKDSYHDEIISDYFHGKKFGRTLETIRGFISDEGKFLTREEAYALAREAGQVKKPAPEPWHDEPWYNALPADGLDSKWFADERLS